MKLIKSLAVAGVGVFCLTSCNTHAVRYDLDRYYLELPWKSDFNILQLTDLHISNMSDNDKQFKFIKKTVDKAREILNKDPDLIVITGDLFTFANKSDAIATFDFFDSLQIPWAPTWGNHDEQNYFSVSWLTSQLNARSDARIAKSSNSYCVFRDLQDDDVFGNANYVINLVEGEGTTKKIKEQLFIFDSNRYNYGEGFGYDYIHYDQIDWYERIVVANTTHTEASDNPTPSLAFFHIPFPEFEEGYQNASKNEKGWTFFEDEDGKTYKNHDTSTGDPKKNTGLFTKMVDLKSTKGVFIGHNHTSDYLLQCDINAASNIKLCCGVKSTNKVYCDEDRLGGQIIRLNDEGDFKIKRIYTKYSEI